MKIIVTGGTGFIGRPLVNEFSAQGYEMVVLTRKSPERRAPLVRFREWDAVSAGAWQDEVSSADAVVNRAGEPIAEGRWTASRKRLLIDSRVQATRRIVDALGAGSATPPILTKGSGIGYYGSSDDRVLIESSPRGAGFWQNSPRPGKRKPREPPGSEPALCY